MEKNQKHKRSTEEVLVSFFPDIDVIALRKILQDDVCLSPSRKRKSINDEAFHDSAKKFKNITFYSESENDQLDKMFAEKEKKYLNNVKKAVTTVALPNMANPLKKEFIMPQFLKQNIKKIYSVTGRSGYYITNRLRISNLKKSDTVFTLFITGSEDTYYSYKMLTRNFCGSNENHKSIFAYIVPKVESEMTYNYKNRKDIIIDKYTGDMRNLDADRYFFCTDTSNPKEYPSTLAQYYKFISKYTFSYSLYGFSGLKGPKGDKKELERNLKFLMKYQKEPFIITKQDLYQEEKSVLSLSLDEPKKFSWLFVFDRINHNCFNCFYSFSKLVNFKNDKISALTLLNTGMEDDIKPKLTKELNEKGITDFPYFSQEYTSESGAIVKKKVNFDSDHYDYVVIYNSFDNSEVNKVIYEKQNVSNYQIITECLSNVCVHNGK